MKRFFVKPIGGKEDEVSRDEYLRMANQQFFGKELTRILINAKKGAGCAGTTHTFWTVDV